MVDAQVYPTLIENLELASVPCSPGQSFSAHHMSSRLGQNYIVIGLTSKSLEDMLALVERNWDNDCHLAWAQQSCARHVGWDCYPGVPSGSEMVHHWVQKLGFGG